MKYKLRFATMAIESTTGKPSTVAIPPGAILRRIGTDGSLEKCEWEGREVKLLLYDLMQRGERLSDPSD